MSNQESEKHKLPEAFLRGLSTARLSGRAQVVEDSSFGTCKSEGNEISFGNLMFYLDGAHSPESMDACARWFSNAVKAEKTTLQASSFSEVNNLENISGKTCIENNEWKGNKTTKQVNISSMILLLNLQICIKLVAWKIMLKVPEVYDLLMILIWYLYIADSFIQLHGFKGSTCPSIEPC